MYVLIAYECTSNKHADIQQYVNSTGEGGNLGLGVYRYEYLGL